MLQKLMRLIRGESQSEAARETKENESRDPFKGEVLRDLHVDGRIWGHFHHRVPVTLEGYNLSLIRLGYSTVLVSYDKYLRLFREYRRLAYGEVGTVDPCNEDYEPLDRAAFDSLELVEYDGMEGMFEHRNPVSMQIFDEYDSRSSMYCKYNEYVDIFYNYRRRVEENKRNSEFYRTHMS